MSKGLTKAEKAEIAQLRKELLNDKAELAKIDKAGAELFEREKIYHFNTEIMPANPLQSELLQAWEDEFYKIFTYTGANRIGKCLTYQTLIDTPAGEIPVGELYESGSDFDVFAWDGEKKVVARASAPFKKEGTHECYEITMDDGSIIQGADRHLILCADGEYRAFETIANAFQQRPQEDASVSLASGLGEEGSLSVRAEDGQRSTRTTIGSQHGCFVNPHPSDGQPLSFGGVGQSFSPLQGDAQPYSSTLFGWDVQESIRTSNHQLSYGLLSILDALHQIVAQSVGFVSSFLCRIFVAPCRLQKAFFERLSGLAVSLRSEISHLGSQVQSSSTSFTPSVELMYTGGNRIISIKPIGVKDVFDFEVEKYHNYCAGGLVHHNTFIGAVIGISTMIGRFPWNDKRLSFSHAKPRRIRLIGQDWEKHIKTVVIPAWEELWPKNRPLKVKKNSIGVESMWTDEKTGSTMEIMSNNQDSDLHEGWNGDLIIYDEPPKRDIRVANARGLIDRNGRELYCMTLLKEAWVDREVIKATNDDGTPDRTVYNIQGEIHSNVGFGITKEGVEQFAKTLTDDEKQARIHGKPSYMSGLVAKKFRRSIHLKKRFEIPTDWIVDIGIDIHPRKQQMILFVATSPKNERYVIHEVWDHGDGAWVGDMIVKICNRNCYRVENIICDPLAKGDSNSGTTTFEKIDAVLAANNLPELAVGSKDKQSGVIEMNKHLEGPNGEPSLFLVDDLVRTVYEIEGWMYDKETQTPKKEDDDAMECLYRILLLDTEWSAKDTSWDYNKDVELDLAWVV